MWYLLVLALLALLPRTFAAWHLSGGQDGTNGSPVYSLDAQVFRKAVESGEAVSVPALDGEPQTFLLERSRFAPPNRFGVKVFSGRATDGSGDRLHLVMDGNKLHAQVISGTAITYIDPVIGLSTGDSDVFESYRVYRSSAGERSGMECLAADSAGPEPEATLARQASAPALRTFRLAAATTAEYTQFFGSKAEAYAALVTALSRASGIFEREVGVRFELVPETDAMVFENPETDPYTTNEPTYELLRNAQNAFDAIIGTENYDLGIVLTRGTYGLAYIRSVCDPLRKGSSCIGLPEPTGDAFHVNLVTHELAHQFGANHTFNSPTGFCAARRNQWTAFEPGAGSTIMSYGTLPCGDDRFVERNDAYFHSENLHEILSFVGTLTCGTSEPMANNPPLIEVGPDFTIPILTPFQLEASGSDPDGDTVFYNWEQRDLGPAQTLGAPDNGTSPLFRSYPPTESPVRVFPALPYILAGENPLFEQLPSTNRYMAFRIVARDSQNNGAVTWADTHLHVTDTAGPFEVTSHQSAEALGEETEVKWSVAGTDQPPISLDSVRISLSTDGGQTYPHVLAESTPNDGSEKVAIPSLSSSNARIKVSAVGNVFFALNGAPLTLGDSTELRIVEFHHEGGQLRISWTSQAGQSYRVESRSLISAGPWIAVTEMDGVDGTTSATLPLPENGDALFRVERQ